MFLLQDYKKVSLLILWLCLLILPVNGQGKIMADPKSAKAYNAALQLNMMGKQDEALKVLLRLIKKDEFYTQSYWLAAEIYKKQGKTIQQFQMLKSACNPSYAYYTQSIRMLLNEWYLNGKYSEAATYLDQNSTTFPEDEVLQDLQERIRFSVEAVANPVQTVLAAPNAQLNTPWHDYWPSMSVDGKSMVTSVLVCDTFSNGRTYCQEDIFYSNNSGGSWTPIQPVGEVLNTEHNEGGHCISADGNYLFFTACNRNNGYGGCDIFYAHKENGKWSKPIPCPAPVNSKSWDGHPSIEGNGAEIYFSSDREGGIGGKDLWRAKINYKKNGLITFSELQNLGEPVNTKQDEISPFIHFDSQSLYFASTGHIGLGRNDIFFTQKQGNTWKEPVNLGYPINSNKDEIGFVVEASGKKAWMASERNGRDKDIYSLEVPLEVQPYEVIYYKGIVKDKNTLDALSAEVAWFNFKAKKPFNVLFSNRLNGEFMVCLRSRQNYALHIQKPGYLFYSQFVGTKTGRSAAKPFVSEIYLEPIEYGNIMILENVFFETGSYALKPESAPELNLLKQLFDENPELRIEIGGHTDSIGNAQYNLELSENRAKSVCQFLVDNGIKEWRLSYKGYGSSQPIESNATAGGRAKNRRTEAKIIK